MQLIGEIVTSSANLAARVGWVSRNDSLRDFVPALLDD
jgi:hypothetical protein